MAPAFVRMTMYLRPLRLAAASLAVLLVATACQNSESSTDTSTPSTPAPQTTIAAPVGFDDHTVAEIATAEDFDRLARVEGAQSAVKFAIPDLSGPGVVWMDSSFYELHDEWYWFRLLNGERVQGLPAAPVVAGPEFSTIDEVYAWASARPADLPLDLRFSPDGDRLYSDRFYDLALRNADKTYGLGTLVRYNTEKGERWVIEMQFSEETTTDSVGDFFDRLAETLPAEISDHLAWVPRSPEQAQTADAMLASGSLSSDQIVRYADLVPRGEVAVYNPGLTAGRLRLIEGSDDLNRAGPNDILVMENVPDWLPPAAAILTSSPQTPLAHVNLLARNRGIPNVSVGGLLDDPAISIAARSRGHAVVSATAAGELEITLISKEQYEAWSVLQEPTEISVPPVDMATTPTTLSLTELAATIDSEANVAALRPTIGGKSAGFLALIAADEVTIPDTPVAITVAPYFRHLELIAAELDAMLADEDFRSAARVRFLLLEGPEEYADVYATAADAVVASAFSALHPDGPLRAILDADGFMKLFRDLDMAEADVGEITGALESTFASLSDLQGLRFRSSSSIEDIEGFSGAGLYDSNTGFLQPELQADEGDHKKTVERTIKKTWASYWSFEAFEERRLESVDHRSGGMGVLVHPRFDDALEANNGVATLMLLPEANADTAVLTINVQAGDVSVTNPEADSDVLPEQIIVSVSDEGEATIERVAASTLVGDGERVMEDEAVLELLGQLEAVATLWRNRVNGDLEPAQQVGIVTLDFEFKHMAEGWPAMDNGDVRPARLVVKQARSLDPDLRGVSDEVLELPIPRDVLARAILLEHVVCESGASGIEVTISSSASEDVLPGLLQFSQAPGDLDGERCERRTLLSSPEQLLVELLESGEGLVIG